MDAQDLLHVMWCLLSNEMTMQYHASTTTSYWITTTLTQCLTWELVFVCVHRLIPVLWKLNKDTIESARRFMDGTYNSDNENWKMFKSGSRG